jgi:formylglycine-generating enzyme required for sulfatase activity
VLALLVSSASHVASLAEANERIAAEGDRAREHLRDVFALADIEQLDALEREANEELWPARSERIPAIRDWLVRAEEMRAKLASFEQKLAVLEAQALPRTPEEEASDRTGHERWAELQELEVRLLAAEEGSAKRELAEQVRRLRDLVAERRSWSFAGDATDGISAQQMFWRHRHLGTLVKRLHAFVKGPVTPHGTLGIWGPSITEVQRRIPLIESWRRVSLDDPSSQGAWTSAITHAALPRPAGPYGFALPKIEGLVPLGVNPRTKLLEFWHVPTGTKPEPHPEFIADGDDPPMGSEVECPNCWALDDHTGVVLVLIPGGRYRLGAQRTDETAPHYDGDAQVDEGIRELELAPFLISKYELTQAQWLRWCGTNPSTYKGIRLPVENMSWEQARTWLRRAGLGFPTEAQWEAAARAGSTQRFWTGREERTLQFAENLADATLRALGGTGEYVGWSDGFAAHAPVGSFRANAYGLHDVLGSVAEWCADDYRADVHEADVMAGNGLWVEAPMRARGRVFRGGRFDVAARWARSAYRGWLVPSDRGADLGLRPFAMVPR